MRGKAGAVSEHLHTIPGWTLFATGALVPTDPLVASFRSIVGVETEDLPNDEVAEEHPVAKLWKVVRSEDVDPDHRFLLG